MRCVLCLRYRVASTGYRVDGDAIVERISVRVAGCAVGVGILRLRGGCASLAATSLRMTVEFMNLLATDN